MMNIVAYVEDQKVQVEVLTRLPVVELKTTSVVVLRVVKADHGVIKKTVALPLTVVSSPDIRRPPTLESLLRRTVTVGDQRNQLDLPHHRDSDRRVLHLTGCRPSTRGRRRFHLQLSC